MSGSTNAIVRELQEELAKKDGQLRNMTKEKADMEEDIDETQTAVEPVLYFNVNDDEDADWGFDGVEHEGVKTCGLSSAHGPSPDCGHPQHTRPICLL